ncbi:hypothetical protein BH09VER1_BH09VER1_09190 [soil metagenome]
MKFTNPDSAIAEDEILRCEADCGIRLPCPLRLIYLDSNGGEPDPYVFQNDELDTVVSEFLPLKSELRGTAVQSYIRLVREKAIVFANFFPFAVDGGGDYFFVDTKTPDGKVYIFRSEATKSPALLPLGIGIDEFWMALKPE